MTHVFSDGEIYIQDGVLVVDLREPHNHSRHFRDIKITFTDRGLDVTAKKAVWEFAQHCPILHEFLTDEEWLASAQEQYIETVEKVSVSGFLKTTKLKTEVRQLKPGWFEHKKTNKPYAATTTQYRIFWSNTVAPEV